MTFAAWFKVTRVVEHVIFGKQGLVRETEQAAIANNRGRVINLPPCRLIVRPNRADDRGQALGRANYFVQRFERGSNDVRIEKPIK